MKLLKFCTKRYEEEALADVKMENFVRKPIKFKYKRTPHLIDQEKIYEYYEYPQHFWLR